MNTERVRIWLGFAIVSTVWGSTWLAIKIGLQSVPPLLAAGTRFLVASTVLFAIVRIRRLRIPFDADARKLYLTLSILSFSIPFALVYWSEQFIPSGLSSILFSIYPFWVAICAHLFLKGERLDLLKLSGITVGFIGILIVFSGDVHWSDPNALAGMLAVLASALLQGFALILIKKYGQSVSPFVMNLVGMSSAGIILLLSGLLLESGSPISLDSRAIGSILYLALVGSVLTFVTYHWLLKRIEAVYLSLTSFINPIVAVILGAVVLGESLEPRVFVGAAFVLSGILLANGKQLYMKFTAQGGESSP
jgi:drug/metabolite transporter (DMT)-like permease